jgi:hypothetical protein
MFHRATAITELTALLAQTKALSPWPTWEAASEGQAAHFKLVAGLSVNGIDVAGLRLFGQVPKDGLGEDMVLMLQALLAGRWRPIERFEYQPLRGHLNPRDRRDFPSRIADGVSHAHRFMENAVLGLTAFEENNLPLARPLEPPPSSLNDFRRIVSDAINIPDLIAVPWPELQRRLL